MPWSWRPACRSIHQIPNQKLFFPAAIQTEYHEVKLNVQSLDSEDEAGLSVATLPSWLRVGLTAAVTCRQGSRQDRTHPNVICTTRRNVA